jgi:hypothetical protein
MDNQVFQDKEIRWFYGIIIGLHIFVLVLELTDREWALSFVVLLLIFCFLFLGWPILASASNDGNIIFKGPMRRVAITPKTLISIKASGARDYRAHLVVRVRSGLPIGYRCRKYENAPELAQAMLDLIEKTPNAKVTDDALKLLKQVAKGNRKPLPLKQ